MKDLKPRPIKDFALGIFDGPHATPAESSDGAVFLGIKNITDDGRLDFSDIRYVSEQELPKWTRRVTPQINDVVLTYEATLHRYAIIPDGFRGCLGRRVALVRPNPDKADSRFMLYYFLSPNWRSIVETYVKSGATVDRLPLEKFPDMPVRFPNLGIQQRIASILSAYDDLIENNRRRIALLEESARLLYREWFVRLRFPGHEHTRIVNGVPEGWRNLKLGDICTDNRQMVSPESLEPDTPYIGLEHMPRRSISLSDWGTAEQVTSSKLRFHTGDILFGKIRPYFHKVGIAFTDGVVSSDAFVIRSIAEELKSFVLMTVSSDEFIANTSQAMKEGSKMPRADWKQMIQYPVLLPPDGLLADFTETITSITDQLRNLSTQNQKLRTARDLLLPKLMSGEIEI